MKRLIALVLILSAHSAYCWNFYDFFCCNEGVGTGFYLGGNGSFGNFDFQFEDDTFQDNVFQKINFFDYDSHQIAEGGGFFLGYGTCFCDRFRLALQFDANWYGNRARHSFNYADLGDNFASRVQCEHLYDVSVRPGIALWECLLLNLQFGVSWAGIDFKTLIVEDDTPYPIRDRRTKHFTETGYVLGAGVQVPITCRFSAIVEYSWHKFCVSEKNRTFTTIGGTDVTYTSDLKRFSATLFKFGLAYRI